MKTERYTIIFENLEASMSREIIISRSEFNRQLSYMRQQVRDTQNNEYPVEELECRITPCKEFTKTVYTFACGCAYTDLTEIICNDGYAFKKGATV